MHPTKVRLTVRTVSAGVSVIDIRGEMSAFAEQALLDAYWKAAMPNNSVVVLNFSELEYMNGRGIGLLISLLIQIRKQQQRLLACRLSPHYQYLLELTRLDQFISISDTETEALTAAHATEAMTGR